VLAVGVVWTLWHAYGVASRRVPVRSQRSALLPTGTPWQNAQPHVKYVGDAACARCHPEIADTFRRHPMGRSLATVGPPKSSGGDRPPDSTTTFEAGSSRFTIDKRGGHQVHRETRVDETGRVLATVEAEVKYALGSGTRGTSYLHQRNFVSIRARRSALPVADFVVRPEETMGSFTWL
jgi:hypothetical protein